MIDKKIMIKQLRSLVSTAYGCTEIGLIGYAVASCTNLVARPCNSTTYKKIIVEVSPFIYKNVFRVGVPNLGVCGIKMIVATSAMIADPKRKLEIFATVTPKQKLEAKKLINNDKVVIKIAKNVNPVYARVMITTNDNVTIESLVSHYHDYIVYIKKNDRYIVNNGIKEIKQKQTSELKQLDKITFADIMQFVKSCTVKDLNYLNEISEINMRIANYGIVNVIPDSFTENYLKTMDNDSSLYQRIILNTAAAIDARMNGATLPVATSCGSGDHGLTSTIPQYQLYTHRKIPYLRYLQSLALVNFVVWMIKKNIGHLSAFCGSVIAAVPATLAGLAYQLGMNSKKIDNIISSVLCSNALCVCDGAKSSCTHKISTALICGLRIFDMVDKGYCVKPRDGIIASSALSTIKIFKKISNDNLTTLNNSIIESIIKIDKQKHKK